MFFYLVKSNVKTAHPSSSDWIVNFVVQCLHPGTELKLTCLLFGSNHYVYSVIFIYVFIIYTLFYSYSQLFHSQGPHHKIHAATPGKTGKLNYVCIDFTMLKSVILSLPTNK